MKLKGQTALITGGNTGIGLATARLFVAAGARVAITGRNKTTLDAAAKELGQNALTFRADVLNSKAREEWSDQNSKWESGSSPAWVGTMSASELWVAAQRRCRPGRETA